MPLPHDFNLAGRREALTRLGHDRLDLLIVGGGITGCGIARDAALRGWTVGLVEKEDFAFGTSSRSSKIVHGGVRYLEYGHFLLVKEAAQERGDTTDHCPPPRPSPALRLPRVRWRKPAQDTGGPDCVRLPGHLRRPREAREPLTGGG